MSAAVVPLAARVEQARRAAADGQIRMTEIYTDRALQLVAIERAKFRKDLGLANRKLRAHRMGAGVGAFFEGVVEIVQETFQPIVDAYGELGKLLIACNPPIQKDYLLTSQVEHRDQRLMDAMFALQAGEVLTEDQRRFL